jgi:hypothetical protein
MSITTYAPQYRSPYGELYDSHMATTKTMGVEALRKVLGAEIQKATEAETHIVVSKHGAAQAVVVPMDWYRKARKALKDPTDL